MISLRYFTIHVSNVWQTCEWYRMVFGIGAILSADASAARLQLPGQRVLFAAHDLQDESCGPRRPHSFLHDPPALHFTISSLDVQATFDHAVAHGAVPVSAPLPDAQGHLTASLRDLNGLLLRLVFA